jgi:adenylate kinase family enzyme
MGLSVSNSMRVLIFGNSGSGKSTLAKNISAEHGLAYLDLDCIVWEPEQIAVQRSRAAIEAALQAFLSIHNHWVIEGCYGELIALALAQCSELIFLNPGLAACLANNRTRPWEAHKYANKADQDAMLDKLQAWVSDYYQRDHQWSYAAHRAIFDRFAGAKRELITSPAF